MAGPQSGSQFALSPDALAALAATQQKLQQTSTANAVATAGPGAELNPVAAAVQKDDPTKASISSTLKTYYSRLDGSRFYFKDGSAAVFHGGVFHIDPENPEEPYTKEQWTAMVKDLEYVCGVPNSIFSKTHVVMHKSDVQVLREVGRGGSADPRSGTGLVSSTSLIGVGVPNIHPGFSSSEG